MKTRSRTLLATALLAAVLGCNSGSSPVAPSGTLITITAIPSLIAPFGTSEIQVKALHPSGVPAREGTEFQFTATMGTIDAMAVTDSNGIARATFRSDGRGPRATISASSGAQGSASTMVTIEDAQLVANFEATQNGLAVSFRDTSSGPQPPTTWDWDFGDGKSSSKRNPEHTYKKAGSYNVTLTVSNPETTASTSRPIGVVGARASFTFTVNDLTVTFSDQSSPTPIAWEWRFGDGNTSTLRSPSHTYDREGTYKVRLEITTASAGSDSTSESVAVTEPELEPPTANFFSNSNGLSVIFSDSSTGDPTSWSWEFGDGATSNQQDPVHTYKTADTYLVSLTARNADGSDTHSAFVTVQDPIDGAPSAQFTTSIRDLTVIFTDTSSGDPTSWSWDFGDGSGSSEENPVHTYAAEGTYVVSLTASNAEGSDTATNFVTVAGPSSSPPNANFSTSTNGLTVIFTDSSTGNPTSWSWDFGDGSTSTQQNPVYTYAAGGTYVVSLTATNDDGSDTTSKFLTVP